MDLHVRFDNRSPVSGKIALNWVSHATRILFPGRPAYGKLAVSFNLVEIRLSPSDNCGTFACLAKLAGFLKGCGVCQMRVHLETRRHAALLDPVHLNLSCPERGLSRDAVRDGKARWAIAQPRNAIGFTEFRRLFGDSLSGVCRSEDDLFVQYWCYTQLLEAFFGCLVHGVAVITDVAIDGDPGDLGAVLPL
jgi:hypothetical protein